MKIELHVHTRTSKDSILGKYAILFVCKVKKIEGLFITEHNRIISQKNVEFFEKRGIQIIIGEEIMTQEGEIIGMFLKEKVSPMMSVELTINEIKKQGGLVYIPHPFDSKREKTVLNKEVLLRNAYQIDFIEIYNGRNSKKEDVEEEKKIYMELTKVNSHIIPVIGSDAHICWEMGRNVCEIKEKLNVKNAKKVLEQANITKKIPINFAHKWTKIVKILRIFNTLETMYYEVVPMAEIVERSKILAMEVWKDFQPDIVIFVAKGGFIVGRTFSEVFSVPLYAISTERKGGKLKKWIAPMFRVLPKKIRFWLIDLEMNLGIHKKVGERTFTVSEELKEKSIELTNEVEKILIVDDSVDTGATAKAAKEEIHRLFPKANIRFASLSCIRFSEDSFCTDYYLYKDTIIETGTSKDSPEYAEFLEEYRRWENR